MAGGYVGRVQTGSPPILLIIHEYSPATDGRVMTKENGGVMIKENGGVKIKEKFGIMSKENGSVMIKENGRVMTKENDRVMIKENISNLVIKVFYRDISYNLYL